MESEWKSLLFGRISPYGQQVKKTAIYDLVQGLRLPGGAILALHDLADAREGKVFRSRHTFHQPILAKLEPTVNIFGEA